MSRTAARFPSIGAEAAHYESFYMKASPPEGGRALWVRHTVHKRPGQAPTAAVWMTYFTANGRPPLAIKQQVGEQGLSIPRGSYIRVDESEIAPGRVTGEVAGGESSASWNLRFGDLREPFRHLPRGWMYERSLPRTKPLSPHPAVIFDGILEVGGERVDVEAWPGMVGHNWGSEHAESWIWLSGHDPSGSPDDHVDLTIGRVRLGPLLTPWIANGQVVIDGQAHRLGGIERAFSTKVDASPTGAELRIPGKSVSVEGTIGAPAHRFVGWIYSDPKGGEHHALNCSVADLDLKVLGVAGGDRRMRAHGSAVYEFGTKDRDHGIAIQAFPDG